MTAPIFHESEKTFDALGHEWRVIYEADEDSGVATIHGVILLTGNDDEGVDASFELLRLLERDRDFLLAETSAAMKDMERRTLERRDEALDRQADSKMEHRRECREQLSIQ